jgi:hypothetical protein
MPPNDQLDLFDRDEPDDVLENRPSPVYRADPDKVRAELHKILAAARAAQEMPWGPERVRYYRTDFPQMSKWLPDDEAAQLRCAFEAELARLERP